MRRRKTSASSCDLDVDGGKLKYQCFRIPGVNIHGRNSKVKQWFAVKPCPISSRTRTKYKSK